MTKLKPEHIIQILTLIRVNNENAYANLSADEVELLANSWYSNLKEYSFEVVYNATNNALKKSPMIPRLANIIEEAEKLVNSDKKSDEELWAELTSVLGRTFDVSRYLSYPQHYEWANKKLNEIYGGLSDGLKTYVVNLSTLVELSQLSPESLQYERARFFKQMPVLKTHAANKKAAEKFIGQTNAVAALPETTNKKK